MNQFDSSPRVDVPVHVSESSSPIFFFENHINPSVLLPQKVLDVRCVMHADAIEGHL